MQKEIILPKPDEQLVSSFSVVGCPNGYVSNGKGKCYNAVSNKSVREGTNENPIIIIRREIGAPLSDFSSKPDITGRKLLPPKPNPDPNPPTICIEWYLCYGGNCDYISTTCHGETIDGGGGGGGDNPFGGGDGGGGGFGEEDREEFKLGSLDWTAISKGWQIISNETGYVKRSQRNPTWKVYQDLSHSSLRLNGDFVGQISFSLIRTPHTNHSESNASIGLYINVVEQTPTWWGGTLNSADDYERFASWSANQIASH